MKALPNILIAVCLVSWTTPAQAYLKFGVRVTSGTVVDVRWSGPINYFVTERGSGDVSALQMRDVIARAFATWQSAPNAAFGSQFQGFTIAPPGVQDQRSTFGFLDRPELDRVLGATSFLLDSRTGEILEADIFFNTRFDWSVAPSGQTGRVDLESVAVHEIGHLLGLGHSALGETEMIPGGRRVIASGAVMFPIAFASGSIADRQLQPDDLAGISDLYGRGLSDASQSSISGRVTKNGSGVFGAHVVAMNLRTGTLVGGFSLNLQGEFVLAGLQPGSYVLRVEPLDDADTESFFSGPIDVDFRVTYAARAVVAPPGGGSDRVEIAVRPK